MSMKTISRKTIRTAPREGPRSAVSKPIGPRKSLRSPANRVPAAKKPRAANAVRTHQRSGSSGSDSSRTSSDNESIRSMRDGVRAAHKPTASIENLPSALRVHLETELAKLDSDGAVGMKIVEERSVLLLLELSNEEAMAAVDEFCQRYRWAWHKIQMSVTGYFRGVCKKYWRNRAVARKEPLLEKYGKEGSETSAADKSRLIDALLAVLFTRGSGLSRSLLDSSKRRLLLGLRPVAIVEALYEFVTAAMHREHKIRSMAAYLLSIIHRRIKAEANGPVEEEDDKPAISAKAAFAARAMRRSPSVGTECMSPSTSRRPSVLADLTDDGMRFQRRGSLRRLMELKAKAKAEAEAASASEANTPRAALLEPQTPEQCSSRSSKTLAAQLSVTAEKSDHMPVPELTDARLSCVNSPLGDLTAPMNWSPMAHEGGRTHARSMSAGSSCASLCESDSSMAAYGGGHKRHGSFSSSVSMLDVRDTSASPEAAAKSSMHDSTTGRPTSPDWQLWGTSGLAEVDLRLGSGLYDAVPNESYAQYTGHDSSSLFSSAPGGFLTADGHDYLRNHDDLTVGLPPAQPQAAEFPGSPIMNGLDGLDVDPFASLGSLDWAGAQLGAF